MNPVFFSFAKRSQGTFSRPCIRSIYPCVHRPGWKEIGFKSLSPDRGPPRDEPISMYTDRVLTGIAPLESGQRGLSISAIPVKIRSVQVDIGTSQVGYRSGESDLKSICFFKSICFTLAQAYRSSSSTCRRTILPGS